MEWDCFECSLGTAPLVGLNIGFGQVDRGDDLLCFQCASVQSETFSQE